jgi:hypothetical protein
MLILICHLGHAEGIWRKKHRSGALFMQPPYATSARMMVRVFARMMLPISTTTVNSITTSRGLGSMAAG